VAVGYGLLVLLRTSQSMSLTFDEVVYASQVSADTPAARFSAPRARGMPLLLAPVVTITEWVFPLRVYLTMLAGGFMYLAFRPWLAIFGRVGGRYRFVPAAAAAGLATLWLTVLYGTQGYPNVWLCFVLVAGVGYFCRAVGEPGWRPVAGVVVAFAAASLIRPTDALLAAGPLLVVPVVVRAWRRWRPWVAVAAGLAVGWGAWIAEAFARFDGPIERLRAGAETNRGGLVNTLPEHLHALDGPAVLCRPHSLCEGVDPIAAMWWFVLPVLVVVGLVVAARSRWLGFGLLAAGSAVAVAGPYLFYIDYAAPRFLLPSYGLLAIPAAAAVLWLTGLGKAELRAMSAVVVAGGLLVHIAVQQDVLETAKGRLERSSRSDVAMAEFLRDEEGVRPACLFWGEGAIQLGYQLKCRSHWVTDEPPAAGDPVLGAALARGDDVVVRMRADLEVPEFMAGWRRVELPGSSSSVAYLPPGSR
jgi:hypothetical protein